MDSNIYLKLIGHRGRIKIWTVNGAQVRQQLDEEFTNFGQHYRFSCIPENEFWIDTEAVPDERRFFIDHLLVEWNLMRQGMSYEKALDLADLRERAERGKTQDFHKVSNQAGIVQPEKCHSEKLGKVGETVTVWICNGRLVRSVFYTDFTSGGHEFVYSWVPKNEVWIDNDLVPAERPFTILHELFERRLMKKGWSYPAAHRHASKIEWQCRNGQKDLPTQLRQLHFTTTQG
jgi:hypothetical protein